MHLIQCRYSLSAIAVCWRFLAYLWQLESLASLIFLPSAVASLNHTLDLRLQTLESIRTSKTRTIHNPLLLYRAVHIGCLIIASMQSCWYTCLLNMLNYIYKYLGKYVPTDGLWDAWRLMHQNKVPKWPKLTKCSWTGKLIGIVP